MSVPEIPGFTFVEHVGSGGFADVLLYEQDWPRQRVAVKVVRADISLDEREKRSFRSEADALARLADHPYIVSVLTAGETPDGRPYLVMRYCPPPDLGVRVRTAPMSVADALSTGIKLASAVETAHRSGILHRDIKPSNVLVTTYSEPALSDFGIAGRIHEVDSENDVRISFPWAPPELVDGRSNGSVASDVYSLGATIWNLLVGRSPYSVPHGDNSSHALTGRILAAPPPSTGRPDVPAALDRLLQQCLAKQPDHRPTSALHLARSLQRIESAAGFARTPVAVEAADPTATAPRVDVADPEATRLKPISVTPSGAQPAGPAVQDARDAEEAAGSGRPRLWAGAGAAVLAAVAVLVVVVGGRGPADAPATSPSVVPSISDPLVGAGLPAPEVVARPVPGGAEFSWRSLDDSTPGDTWEWRDVGTGRTDRIRGTRLTRRGEGRLCLEVRLIRSGETSPWTKRCAG